MVLMTMNTHMKKTIFLFTLVICLSAFSLAHSQTQNSTAPRVYVQSNNVPDNDSVSLSETKEDVKTEVVNGSVMFSSKDFIDNMANSESLSYFYKILEKAGLKETLKSKGEFTVFAPTTDAFNKILPAKLDSLNSQTHQKELTAVLTYHIVSGRLNLKDLVKIIKKNDGKATLTTVSGSPITLTLEDERLRLTDENGGKAIITLTDINQKNGTLYLIDHVLMPKKKV